jgi:hypothetical protein
VDEAALAFGLVVVWPEEREEPPEVYLWPENVEIWKLFQALRTQWNIGVGGPTGLDYVNVEVVLRKWRVKRSDEWDVFSKIQVMERAMLDAWGEKRNG